MTGTLVHTAGSNTLGLDGATFTFEATVDSDGVYGTTVGQASLPVLTSALTIAGASVPSVNGTHSTTNPAGFFPSYSGQFFDTSGGYLVWSVDGVMLKMFNVVAAVPGVDPGQQVSTGHFGSELAYAPYFAGGDGQWDITDAEFGVTTTDPVPEPAALALVGLVAGMVVAARRRQAGL